MIPFNQFRIVRKFNKWNVIRKTRQALRAYQMNSPISIASVPNACDFIGSFQEQLKTPQAQAEASNKYQSSVHEWFSHEQKVVQTFFPP